MNGGDVVIAAQKITQTNVTPERIIEDLWAGWRAQTLVAGIELDLFTHIAEGRLTAKEIASSVSASEHGTRRLLDALVGLGYLKKQGSRDNSKLAGLAICHCGAGTEAGSGACYIKFGAVRPGSNAGRVFDRLLDACETLASLSGMSRLVAGVNTGRYRAYHRMIVRGFRTDMQGVAMQRPNKSGYNRPNVYVIDDWR